jgi:antitoxin component YwqK of YwqJK toxin-antitoxin module
MKTLWIPMALALTQAGSTLAHGQPDRVLYTWYENGSVESVRPYRGTKKVGTHRLYWPDGTRRLEAHYEDDAYDGVYRTWHPSGRPAEVRLFARGRESGRQQAWTPEGVLYLNYEVRGGRHYGLINARPCVPIHEVRS